MFPRHLWKDNEMCHVQEGRRSRTLVFAAILGQNRVENPHWGHWMPLG